jgi:hypothetical protein
MLDTPVLSILKFGAPEYLSVKMVRYPSTFII